MSKSLLVFDVGDDDVKEGPERRVLVTGFEPFGTGDFNPSWPVAQEVVTNLQHDPLLVAVAAELACSFGPGMEQLKDLIADHNPDLVICLGLAQGRSIPPSTP